MDTQQQQQKVVYQKPHERTLKHKLGGLVANAPSFFPAQLPPTPSTSSSVAAAAEQPKKETKKPRRSPHVSKNKAATTTATCVDEATSPGPIGLSAPMTTEKTKLKIQRRVAPTELTTTLAHRLETKQYDCMICMMAVMRNETIWSCTNCWAIFHSHCISKWYDSQTTVTPSDADLPPLPTPSQIRNADPITAAIYLSQQEMHRAAMASMASSTSTTPKKTAWKCPGCRQMKLTAPKPSCFCGKVQNPAQLHDAVFHEPHSCGAPCGRLREGTSCPHPCTLICHPGTCPPCSALGASRTCFCGKREYRLRCGAEDHGSTCGDPCGKPLSCGHHTCTQVCHNGPCKPCEVQVTQSCYCGARSEPKTCGTGVEWQGKFFSCRGVCGHELACGHHKCTLKCHVGECPQCDLLPDKVTMCPCGKTPLSKQRSCCTDPVPTCDNICGKKLPCGHCCEAKCHIGGCPTCTKTVKKPCRCGSTSDGVACNDATVPICTKVCGARKNCMLHYCNVVCCPGPKTRKQPDPEGLHLCMLVCGKPLNCGIHHCDSLCHPPGSCRKCRVMLAEPIACRCGATVLPPPQPCGTAPPVCLHQCTLPRSCGHRDPIGFTHHCHFGDCPPCMALVDKMCAGGHEMRKGVTCSRAISCGRPCGKPLACGHVCRVPCHGGPCPSYQPNPFTALTTPPPAAAVGCGQVCGKKRECCVHNCKAPCHPAQPCPPSVCREKLTIHCHCGRRTAQVECLATPDAPTREDSLHELECDDECMTLQHSKALAQAFGIRPEGDEAPEYSDYLLDTTVTHKGWVIELEKVLGTFIAGESKTMVTKPMDAPSREFIHKLSKYYGLTAVSEGREPARYIVLSKTFEARVPTKLLSQTVEDNSILSQRYPSQATTSSSSSSSTTASAAAASTTAPTKQTKYNSDGEESYTLRVSDRVSLDISMINSILRPFAWQCQLITLDKKNALAVFQTEGAMRAATKLLIPLGLTVNSSSD